MRGAAITAVPTPQQNHLLAALSPAARGRIFPHLELVSLPLGKTLREPGDCQRYIYFPVDSMVSLLYALESGATTQVSLVGKEGLVGIASFMGGESTPNRAVVVSAGRAYRLLAQRLKDEFERHGETMQLLLRYTQSLLTDVAQTAACNRRHSIGQQVCRWLLLALDRLPNNRLTLSHETIAYMLGVRRESVTEAAGDLLKCGVIEYRHGHITVLNRSKLLQRSCECYSVVRNETERLLSGLCSAGANGRGARDLIAEFPPLPAIRPQPIDDAVATLPASTIPQEVRRPA